MARCLRRYNCSTLQTVVLVQCKNYSSVLLLAEWIPSVAYDGIDIFDHKKHNLGMR